MFPGPEKFFALSVSPAVEAVTYVLIIVEIDRRHLANRSRWVIQIAARTKLKATKHHERGGKTKA